MTQFSNVYSKFLSTIESCTLSEFTPNEINAELFDLLTMSIPEFKYPYISLEFAQNEDEEYYFINDLTIREIRVLVSIMRKNWVEYQLTVENRFEDEYYDSTTRKHSKANLLAQLLKLSDKMSLEAEKVEYNYYRVALGGGAEIGNINE